MAEKIIMPNPADIAIPVAEDLAMNGYLDSFEHNTYEKNSIVQLEQMAIDLGLVDKTYFVTSGRSFLLPVSFNSDNDIEAIQFPHLNFEGEFVTYSTVRIGRLLGHNAVRSLCLTFNNVTLLPYFDTIEEDKLLHVPAFAIQDIDQVPA